ncbi:hypothetical protein CPB84DRAFT_1752252 [Gymnopilus junonius]|uniref:Glucose-methanol-choline oxidoreductase N-terminal domain-containing protein n=1 Tax=Gymnopilus junonius TaxID=109634 RepID=A0A9P5NC97_GYMJU|nr:hypothetical protein CPB84DRAFT_1752252 [Gymnopilus junonius]
MPFITAEDAVRNAFDYVVIGGDCRTYHSCPTIRGSICYYPHIGSWGMINPFGDPNIDIPAQFGQAVGNPKVQSFTRAAEAPEFARDHGGSSAINFQVWSKPPAADVDAFEKLGNTGWNWKDYHEYSKKSEIVHSPTKEQKDLYPHTFTGEYGGKGGPVPVSIAPHFHTIDKLFQETMKGLKTIDDLYGGDVIFQITGTWMATSNLDPKTWT